MRKGWRLLWLAAGLSACSTPPPPPTPPPPEAPPVAAAPPVPEPAPAPEPPAPPPPTPAPEPPKATEGILLVGSVSFPDGRTPKAVLITLGHEGHRPIVIFGKNGRFEKRVPEAGTYHLAGLVADGVRHSYLPDEIVVEEGKEVRILLEEARPAALLVTDAATGAPLPGARALRSIRPWGFGYMGPYPRLRKGETETLRADGNGRIDLGTGRGTEELWVVARGRAWTAVEVPHTPGGDVPVRLPPGGSLRLQVPGWSDLENASLYMEFESRSSCSMPDPKASGELLLEGLPCETLSFEVRRGGPPSEAPPLGKGTVTIRAGEEASLTLEMRPGPKPGRAVRVRGSVTFHPGWGDPEGQIHFKGADDANGDIQEMVDLHGTDTIGVRTFVLSRLVPGRYRVEVAQWRTEVTVPEAGGNFAFTIPEPAEVRVRVVADESGEILREADLYWYSKEEDVHSWSTETANPDRRTGEFVIRFLPGPLSLNASAPGRVARDNRDPDHKSKGTPEFPTFAAGRKAEVTLRLVRGGRVKVRLRCDGAPLLEPGLSVMVVVRPEAGDHHAGYSSYSLSRKGDVYTEDGVAPGRRSITVEDEKELFEAVPEKEFDLVAGETAEVTIDLVRLAPRPDVPEVEGILRVLDEESGEPIPDAQVVHVVQKRSERSWRHMPLPRGEKPGEFRFKGAPGIHHFMAEAPGHVPVEGHPGTPVEVLPGQPMEHVFRLARAGELRVTFRGGGASYRPDSVWLRKDGARRGEWSSRGLSVEGAVIREDALATGTYTLQVKPGEGFETGPVPDVVIKAGEVTEVVVDIAVRAPESLATAVRGTVTFHPGWGEVKSEVRFRGLEGEAASVDDTVVLAKAPPGRPVPFVVGHLVPGRYRVDVKPQWATEVDVADGGGTFDFSIPEPAEVLVRVLAEESGKPLSGTRVYWYSSSPGVEVRNGFSLAAENAEEGRTPGEYRLLVPPGTLQVTAEAPGRVPFNLGEGSENTESEFPVLRSGEKTEQTFRLSQAGTVRVLLRCEGRLLERQEVEVWLVRETKGPSGDSVQSWLVNGTGGSLSCDRFTSGKCKLEVRDPEDRFEPVPDREIEVRGGETTEVEVTLVRKK